MATGNYCAFYVAEPFSTSSLGAHATRDFVYYNMLRSWKGADDKFPFNDSHATTYSVRDGSDWEKTLKPRLQERLRNSQNIVLFLSDATINSKAIREEIDYGINTLGLPVIVVYPDFDSKKSLLNSEGNLKQAIRDLWSKLPIFRDSMNKVPTLHVPMDKALIKSALSSDSYKLSSKREAGIYRYSL